MRYRQARVIGGKGAEPGKFASALRGVAVDRQGWLYAAGDSEIKVFDGAGALKRRWGTAKPALAVGIAPDGSVWVGEPRQIEIFDAAGKLVHAWHDDKRLGMVTAIGFAAGGVLAGDASDRAIRHFDRSGRFLNDIGKDNAVNGLLIPNGVVDFSVDAQGVIHAANPGKHRVERYTPAGKLLGHMGRFTGPDPSGFSGCCNPTNVAVAGKDTLCVTEKAGPRAKLYDYEGHLLAIIADQVFDPNCKNMDVAVDARGRVYVAETVKLAVYVFEPESGAGSRPALPPKTGQVGNLPHDFV